ncbi:hypothetical protein GQ54DRAFT_181338 [Martensiomyces pterosporus]|nr:hypothetical protein GQ54DRAFT_181338 [Martensiomyces pterosporus]
MFRVCLDFSTYSSRSWRTTAPHWGTCISPEARRVPALCVCLFLKRAPLLSAHDLVTEECVLQEVCACTWNANALLGRIGTSTSFSSHAHGTICQWPLVVRMARAEFLLCFVSGVCRMKEQAAPPPCSYVTRRASCLAMPESIRKKAQCGWDFPRSGRVPCQRRPLYCGRIAIGRC